MMDLALDDPLDLGPEPWAQLGPKQGRGGATETAKAYAAFQRYYLSPPGDRNLRRLADELGKHRTQIDQWKTKFYWNIRTQAWDRRQHALAAADKERQNREEAAVWAKRKNEMNEERFQLAQQLRARGQQMLTQPLTERKIQRTDDSGNQTVTLKPSGWTQDTALNMIRSSFKLAEDSINSACGQAEPEPVEDVYEFPTYEPEEK